jgi:hypothetical protein
MKKIVILSMAFLFCLLSAQGQTLKADKEKVKEDKKEVKADRVALKKLEGTMVSVQSKNAFNEDFSGATNVTSKRLDVFDEFLFTNKNGKQEMAYYDIDSKLVGTTQTRQFSDLSPKVQEQIKKDYKDYTIGPVIFFNDNETNTTDMMIYGKQFEDSDNYFVELTKGAKKIIVQVDSEGLVFFFTELN